MQYSTYMEAGQVNTAIFSLLGIIIGAALQYFFSRHLDSLRVHRDARTKAYTDYLRCVSEYANPGMKNLSDRQELAVRTADSKCRVCLYGSSSVIAAFAEFERIGATMNSPEQQAIFTRMVSLMLSDSTRSASVERMI